MMKPLLVAALCISLMTTNEGYWGAPEEDNVSVLDKTNFKSFLDQNEYAFVMFYAPWCGHCKSMMPGYSKLAERMKIDKDGVAIGKVDGTVEVGLAKDYGVQSFPVIKLFVKGEPIDYQGGRDEETLYNWLKRKTGQASNQINNIQELDLHAANHLAVLLLYPEIDDEGLKSYMKVAGEYSDVPFAHSSNQEFKEKYGVDQTYAFIVFRSFDDGKKLLVTEEMPSVDTMKYFLELVRSPLVLDFDQKTAEKIFGNESSAIFFFTDDDNDVRYEDFREVASSRNSEIIFSKSVLTGGVASKLAEFLSVTKSEAPAVRIIGYTKSVMNKYRVDDISVEGLTQALDDFKADKLTPYFKSAPAPGTNNDPVKVVVGDTFNDMVINNDDYVLLESYAPWCGHCIELEPTLVELAEKLKHVQGLVISKMDATMNEHPSLQIRGFPTITLYKPDSKDEPERYDGERTFEDLLEFLEEKMNRKLMEEETTSVEL